MTVTLSRRGTVRAVSFLAALVLVPSILALQARRDARDSQAVLRYHAMQSMSDLSLHLQNIDATLQKTLWANTPPMLSSLSSKLWREAGLAKNALDALPIEYLELQNTNKLLSQVGDYCVSLSRDFERGSPITPEQRQNLLALRSYCDMMLDEVLAANDAMQTGSLRLFDSPSNLSQAFDRTPPAPAVAEGFQEFEEGFSAYPTLIYDGPFSDHIQEREPLMLQDQPIVSRSTARQTAAFAAGLRATQLAQSADENGRMPCYIFSGEGMELAITQQGGWLCYLSCSRLVRESNLSHEQAVDEARKFLNSLGVRPVKATYYETSGSELIVNFAARQGDALLYPDLIKVTVALDNGQITGYDARGYLTNHCRREELTPSLSMEEAAGSVSGLLEIRQSQLCLIPSEGLHETLCWEFQCVSPENQNVLVYVNAATGAEEQILLLLMGENGQLTI